MTEYIFKENSKQLVVKRNILISNVIINFVLYGYRSFLRFNNCCKNIYENYPVQYFCLVLFSVCIHYS